MSLDASQVVNSLIAFYRSKGADLSYLLGDPIFQKLPLEERVNGIKAQANTLLEGIPQGLNRQEKNLVWGDVVGGTMTGAGIVGGISHWAAKSHPGMGSLFSHAPSRYKALATIIVPTLVAGAVAGGLAGWAKADTLHQSRKALRNQLQNTARNPSDANALGTLSTAHLHNQTAISRMNILNKIQDKLDNVLTGGYVNDVMQEQAMDSYAHFKNEADLAPKRK